VIDEGRVAAQLEDAAQELLGAEGELIAAIQSFVDAHQKSKGRALDILRQLLRKSREEKAERHRAAFKTVE
jgi:hypothetical protein